MNNSDSISRIERLREKANTLSGGAGVYLMKNDKGKVIYVGKAKVLKNRVTSYFTALNKYATKTIALVDNIDNFDTITVHTEFEALLLESNLIKKYKPKYNILLKDDKGYPFIKLNKKVKFPYFEIAAKRENSKSEYFGPFQSRHIAYQIIDAVSKAFLLPECKGSFNKKNNKTCLNAHIGRCIGVCSGNVSVKEYGELIKKATDVLSGNIFDVSKILEDKMLIASDNLDFERAAYYRDARKSMAKLKEKQHIIANINLSCDAIDYYFTDNTLSVTIISLKNGAISFKYSHLIENIVNDEIYEQLEEYILRYYEMQVLIPKTIYLPQIMEDTDVLAEYLTTLAERKVTVHIPQKGEGKKLLSFAKENSKEFLLLEQNKAQKDLRELSDFCDMAKMNIIAKTIEMYDVSHISGAFGVCGMVVFVDGKPDKSKYRLFNTKSINDDYQNMADAIRRRFLNLKAENESFDFIPDLIVVDGGIGQINAVKPVLEELSIKAYIIGLKKDNKHRTDGIVLENGVVIPLKNADTAMKFATKLQNECHRFSIANHNKKMSKTVQSGSLTKINGIGKIKETKLINYFKSIAKIKKATYEELLKVDGISKIDADNIIAYYKQ
ncbi:MAG: excinuclease ABC subunit UvrC [Clostridia bacterium]